MEVKTKPRCRYCKFSVMVDKKKEDLSRLAMAIIQTMGLKRKEKAISISKLPGIDLAKKCRGIDTMTFKDSISEKRRGGTEYIKCSNLDHLKDENADEYESVVHKYYFACPHFKEAE